MDEIYESNAMQHKPWKKVLCVFLSIILAFGTLVTLTVGSSRLQDWLGIKSMISAYAAEFVDTHGAVALDEETMLSDHTLIDLENRDGSNTVYIFSEPVTFIDENGNLKAKDISVEKQNDRELKAEGYEYTNGQNDYRINFSEDPQTGLKVQFGDCSYTIVAQSSFDTDGTKSIAEFLNEGFEVFQYKNLYGVGTNLRFYPQLNGVKDEIVLDRNIGQDSFSFELNTENCTASLNEDGTVTLTNANGETVQTFSAPFAYDDEFVEGIYDEHYSVCEYSLEEKGNGSYIMTVTVNSEWLNSENTVYPVIIDPTTSNVSDSADAGVYSKYASNNYGNEQTGCFGKDTGYGYGRVYEKFTVPTAIKKGAAIGYAYHWVRETTGETSSTYVRPFMVTGSWSETGITWSNKPGYTTTVNTNWKNINSNSTDNPNNSYWYNYNLVNCVKKWVDGTANYGVVFVSGEEVDADQEYKWRAWASRSYNTSAMRPYTVINYTNDATAPTITSVTGNPSSWTNSNVTLTVNGAADNSGGAGLHSTPYSFSTTKGSYSWQSGNTKTFSSNCTVYVYVRDALGNIRLASTQTISKIDKTKPTAPTVTGNAESWTMDPVTLTATSSDDASGIKDYSFSTVAGTYSWQTSNTKTFDSNTTVYVYARDNAGNISSVAETVISKITNNPSYLIEPKFYENDQLVGIYNPRKGTENMLYKIGEDGEWKTYTVPFALPYNQEVTVYAKFESSDVADISGTFSSKTELIGAYTESNTDFTLSYKNISFDFVRSYNSVDKEWFFATDSSVTAVNDYIIKAVMPDSTELVFVKSGESTYQNELNGYELAVTDNGYIIQIDNINYGYDTTGKLVSVSNQYGDTITITRNDSAITVSDGASRAYTLAIDTNGNITTVTDPANNVITYTYDGNNNLTSIVDQAGVTIGQYLYTDGTLTKSMDKTINYGDDGRVASYVYDSGAYLEYTYNDEDMTVSTESSTETTTSETFNDAFMIVSSTDEDGNTTEYEYDDYYRTVTETSNGTTITYVYDDNGNVLSEVSDDEEAENTYYVYDSNGNLVRQHTGENYTYYVYNENRELTLSATLKDDYAGEIPDIYNSDLTCFDTVSYTYDNGMLTQTVDSKKNETISYTYDSYGNTVKTTTVTENDSESTIGVVDCTYDIMGNLLTSVSGDETSSYIYDNAGRTLLANEKGDCTRTIYDNLGRVIQEIGPEDYDSTKDGLPEENTYSDSTAGQTYVYASNGTLTSETNRIGQTTRYYYNDIGSKVREEFDIYKFYYLNHGELYQVKVANVTTVSYNYDNDFKLVSENYANDDVIRYTYNDNGDVTAQYHNSNANPYVTYTYNDNGDLTEKVNTDTGLKYVYDGDNVSVYKTSDNSLVQSYTSTETEANEETGAEAYTTVTENHFGTTYTSVSREKSVSYTAGTNTAEYSYQTTGTDEDEKLSADTVKYNDSIILSSAYTYDDNGNVLSKSYGESNVFTNTYDDKDRIISTSYAGKTYNYTYDTDSQLTGVTGNNYSASYGYDSRGNITSKTVNDDTTTFTYANSGWKDLLVSVNGTELTYDANGNVLTYGDKEFTWNTGRNLESITDGDNTYSYTYDENGIRTSKTVNGVTTYFNTKDGVILSQTDGTNTMYFQYDTSGAPLGFIYNGTQYFYMTNQMGDVIAITDTAGTVVANYEYDAWGKVLTADTSIAQQNPLRYRGYYLDGETGYYYLQSRYYDPSICRFINADEFEYARIQKEDSFGFNLFSYCYNEPVNNVDYSGFSLNESSVITFFVENCLLRGKYISKWGKIYTDKVGAKVREIKYRKYFNVYEVVRISYGKMNIWKSGISIANRCDSTTINYYSKLMGDSLISLSQSSGKSLGAAIASGAVVVISLSSASKKASIINNYYNKVWGKNGIDPTNSLGYYLICVTKDKNLNGWYIIRDNGRGFRKL